MNKEEKLNLLIKFHDFARLKGFNVNIGSDCGQKIEDKCIKLIRIAKILSTERIEIMEEGKGIYEADLNNLKEIEESLRYDELFKILYEHKRRLIK